MRVFGFAYSLKINSYLLYSHVQIIPLTIASFLDWWKIIFAGKLLKFYYCKVIIIIPCTRQCFPECCEIINIVFRGTDLSITWTSYISRPTAAILKIAANWRKGSDIFGHISCILMSCYD